jgi:hypothetical protein
MNSISGHDSTKESESADSGPVNKSSRLKGVKTMEFIAKKRPLYSKETIVSSIYNAMSDEEAADLAPRKLWNKSPYALEPGIIIIYRLTPTRQVPQEGLTEGE